MTMLPRVRSLLASPFRRAASSTPTNVYQPGQVIQLKRVLKKVDKELQGAEHEFAWQAAIGISLGIIFVAIPFSYNMILYAKSLGPGSARSSTAVIQEQVYEKRLQNRIQLQAISQTESASSSS